MDVSEARESYSFNKEYVCLSVTNVSELLWYQDVAHVGLASILLRESQLDDTAVVIKKALEVSNSWTDVSVTYCLCYMSRISLRDEGRCPWLVLFAIVTGIFSLQAVHLSRPFQSLLKISIPLTDSFW